MFLKANRRTKDGKTHVYYTLNESVRVSRRRVLQRRVLHLGELNTTQVDRWQRTIETIHEDGSRHQLRLFSDREGHAPHADDVVEVVLSSLRLRHPKQFGSPWVGCRLWEELALDQFWQTVLDEDPGDVAWAKVVELLAVNRLCEPRSELSLHQQWFPKVAMDFLLETDARVAEKDRLYRCLDKIVAHKAELEQHLARRWRDLFGATFDLLLYDLTSTYFEGDVVGVEKAQRGYSRDHRPDCKQIVLALIVTPEGLPLSYEVFAGNRTDATTLAEILEAVENKYGRADRVWVFDRGLVEEANLERLRQRGGRYLVGTRKSELRRYQQRLLDGDWKNVSASVRVQLISESGETYVLAQSLTRAQKEAAMRTRVVRGLMRDLVRLRRSVRHGQLTDPEKLRHRLGRLHERWPQAWRYVQIAVEELRLRWHWDRDALKHAAAREGAYLLRTNLTETDPARLWQQYIQLTEVEAAFRALKSELALRPIWHWKAARVEAHVMVAFLGYALWVTLKQKLKAVAPSLTPWQVLKLLGQLQLIEVWFKTRDARALCLLRITEPDTAQAAVLHQLNWRLPDQPPPKIYQEQILDVWET
jgi:transposase